MAKWGEDKANEEATARIRGTNVRPKRWRRIAVDANEFTSGESSKDAYRVVSGANT